MALEQGVDITDLSRLNKPDIELTNLTPLTELSWTQQLFRFMSLPPELCLEIIAYTVISPSTISWQGSYIGDKEQPSKSARNYVCNGINAYLPSRYNIAAPLLASRTLYAHAAPVFYSNNTFRFRSPSPGLPLAFTSPTFTTNLHHLTVGIPTGRLSERQVKRTDKTNGARVVEIARLCPALRTFTNHVPRVFERDGAVHSLPRGMLRPRNLVRMFGGIMFAVAVGLFVYAVCLFAE